MTDIFDKRAAEAMLIADQSEPFDDPNYLFEIKFDGIRCLAYLDKEFTDLRNKRNKELNIHYPELTNLHNYVNEKCILDGEIISLTNGKPDFYKVQKRALTTDLFKIELSIRNSPALFVVYDILYFKNKETIDLSIEERKNLINDNVSENEHIIISKPIYEHGIDLFALTKEQALEGVVAKKKGSKYFYGKRSKDWVKFKHLEDDDYIICGYISKPNNMISLILGKYRNNELIYKGHVTSSVKKLLSNNPKTIESSPFAINTKENENAVWIEPSLVAIVEYMPCSSKGLRQPVFKGFRNDKKPEDCIDK